jgi:hypothetical protein
VLQAERGGALMALTAIDVVIAFGNLCIQRVLGVSLIGFMISGTFCAVLGRRLVCGSCGFRMTLVLP